MKRLIILLIILRLTTFPLAAQYNFVKQWDKRYGTSVSEGLWGLVLANDSSYIVAGYSRGGIQGDKTQDCRGSDDYWIVKFDGHGNKVWDRRFGGDRAEGLHAIVAAKDGGVLLAGYSDSNISGDVSQANRGGGDYWVVKVDAEGNKQWDKRYGGNSDDNLWCTSATNDGGYLVSGYSYSLVSGEKTEPSRGYEDYWVVKIDSMGNKQWDKTLGGSQGDVAYALGQSQDGNYLVAGTTHSSASGDVDDVWFGVSDAWVVKLDINGEVIWKKMYGGSQGDGFHFIKELSENRMLLAGGSGSPADGNKTITKKGNWLVVIDSAGNSLQQYAFDGAAGFVSLSLTSDNGYLLSGQSWRSDLIIGAVEDKTEDCLGRSNTWVLKLDSNFNKQWDKVIFTTGEDAKGYSVETPEGCYVVAIQSKAGIGGYKTQAAWDSSYDYFVVKFCMERVNGIDPLNPPKGDLIQVWPNPVSEEVSIALNAPFGGLGAEATFTLTDINGKILYNKGEDHLAPGYTKVLDLRQLPTGVYFVTVQTTKGQVVKRVVKE